MNSNQRLSNLVHDESGQDLIEYALIAAVIACGAMASVRSLATNVSTALTVIGARLTNAV
jgi:pilus assembly protein Flp/PilA